MPSDSASATTDSFDGAPPVDFLAARELPECRRRIREGATREILHEQLHPLALVAKEVVHFGENKAGKRTRVRA